MSPRIDTRDVIARAEDITRTAQFELRTGIRIRRCECGASLVTPCDTAPDGFVCSGCGEPTSITERIETHLACGSTPGDGAHSAPARERSAPPESSVVPPRVTRKDADAPERISPLSPVRGSGSGVLGRLGKSLRSLRFQGGWRF